MKPAPFRYQAPATLDEALTLLSVGEGHATVLAGGQSLIPAMNVRTVRPAVLVDLNRVDRLDGIAVDAGELRIGAMVRHATVHSSATIVDACPLLAEAAGHIASDAVRHRGTIGGSVAYADPAAEIPAALVALGATLVVESAEARRTIPAAEFFRGAFATALRSDEILTEIVVPTMPRTSGWAFVEIARRHGHTAVVGVALQVTVVDGVCTAAHAAFAGAETTPVVVRDPLARLLGSPLDPDAVEAIAAASAAALDPRDDLQASGSYRRHLAAVVMRRAFARAVARASA